MNEKSECKNGDKEEKVLFCALGFIITFFLDADDEVWLLSNRGKVGEVPVVDSF